MGIKEVELEIHRVMCERSIADQALYRLNGFLAQVVAVLRFHGKRVAVTLKDPAACRVAGSLAILHAEDDLPRVFLRFHAEPSLIREEPVVVEDWRRPSIPRLVVVTERIDKFLRSNVALANLASDIAGRFQVLRKDHVIGSKLCFKPFRRAFSIALNVCVASGEIGRSGRGAERHRTECVGEKRTVLHQRANRRKTHMFRKCPSRMIEIGSNHVCADQEDVRRAPLFGRVIRTISCSLLREAEFRTALLPFGRHWTQSTSEKGSRRKSTECSPVHVLGPDRCIFKTAKERRYRNSSTCVKDYIRKL